MSNLLLTPSKFRDIGGNSPARQWNSGQGRYNFNMPTDGFGLEINSMVANGAGLQPGDSIHFNLHVNSVSPGTRIQVKLGNTTILDQALTNGQDVSVDSAEVQAATDVRIFFVMAGGGTVVNATITPKAETVVEGDTYSLKGFVGYGALASNVPNVVSPLGELSVYSETFAKDRLLFGDTTNTSPETSIKISVFSSLRADTGAQIAVPEKFAETLNEVSRWAYAQALNGQFSADTEGFRQQLLAEFDGLIFDVTVGAMVQQSTIWLPSFVTFYIDKDQYAGYTWPTGSEYLDKPRLKLWFSDAAFSSQYDEFKLEFIAPVDNLDDLFLTSDQVLQRVRARTAVQLTQKIQTLADRKPYTILKSIPFTYHDPLDEEYTFSTDWTFLIYGAAGDNIDAIKEELSQWILDNSTHTREEWVSIFPDIFTSTEFIITPMWNQHAVPNMTLDAGVYSPSVRVQRALDVANGTCVGTNYNAVHIGGNLCVVSCMYKSISLLICGGPENRDGNARFDREYPDYMAVVTSSPDFNRMQPATQAWINKIYEMLVVAEEMTEFSDIPLGMTRLKRRHPNGTQVMYVVATINDVQYLMVSKTSLDSLFPEESDAVDLGLMPNPTVTLSTPSGSQTLQVNFNGVGGKAPYQYAAASVSIVSGTIDQNTGYLNATFDGPGDKLLDVTVTDADNQVFTGSYTVSVSA